MSETEPIPLIARAALHAARTAVIDDSGQLTYAELLDRSARAACALLGDTQDLEGARVAFLTPPGVDYVVAQWGIWRAGGIAVPLCTTHPTPELEYTVGDCGASLVVGHAQFEALLAPIAARRGLRYVSVSALNRPGDRALPRVDRDRGALLLYTSGTTGRPKGVLTTHAILEAQVRSVAQAWEWSERDRILHVLPLHHLHGILNALCAALYAGATCEFLPRFDAERVWQRFEHSRELSLFMAVPTIYAKLAQAFDQAEPERQARMRAGCERLRLMVSGSAALPAAMLERFRAISGHTLLERYGMTEFGMGLGNPLHGERKAGHVGAPFPGVQARLVNEAGAEVAEGQPGDLQIKSPGMFREYFGRPEATRASFTDDGWFKTGDVATREHGAFRILGRESVDILKTGGFKVSALDIEETLREHPSIKECAVVGVPDDVWGQRVAAAAVLHEGRTLELDELRAFCKERLAPYKVPTLLRTYAELPRNAMGKVQKPDLVAQFKEGTDLNY